MNQTKSSVQNITKDTTMEGKVEELLHLGNNKNSWLKHSKTMENY